MQCLTPIAIKPKKNKMPVGGFATELVPCNKCVAYLDRRIRGWSFRLDQESKLHYSAFMITLTYAPEFLPFSDTGYPTLRYTDVQKCFKRLRRNTKCKTIRYYVAGEYGKRFYRPHYHIILFDVEPEDVILAWSVDNVPIGFVNFRDFHSNTCAYAAKY